MNPFEPITPDFIILLCLLVFIIPVTYFVYSIRARKNWGTPFVISVTLFIASFLILILMDQEKMDNPINYQFIPTIIIAVVSLLLMLFLLIQRVFVRLIQVISKYFSGNTELEILIFSSDSKEIKR